MIDIVLMPSLPFVLFLFFFAQHFCFVIQKQWLAVVVVVVVVAASIIILDQSWINLSFSACQLECNTAMSLSSMKPICLSQFMSRLLENAGSIYLVFHFSNRLLQLFFHFVCWKIFTDNWPWWYDKPQSVVKQELNFIIDFVLIIR